MANLAINSVTLSSKNLKLLKKLQGKIMNCYRSTKHNLVRDLMLEHGYEEADVVRMVNKTDHFSDCDTLVIRRDGIYSFSCETTSAWSDNMLPIIKLLHEFYQDAIHISFISEEPGTEQYVVLDESGMFYPEKYRIDWCMDGNYETEYFSSFKEAVNYLKYYFPNADFSYYDTISDIKKSIDAVYSHASDGDSVDYFFNFNKFQEYQYAPDYKEVA